MTRRTLTFLAGVVLSACLFDASEVAGLACLDDRDCGPKLVCIAGTCGARAGDVDVLFVIDNSSSMAGVQYRLAGAIGEFIEPLTAAGIGLRVAVTTTDSGNPRCPDSTPEKGAFQTTGCWERVIDNNEFSTADDDFSTLCYDVCDHYSILFLPSTTEDDSLATPRPWLEDIDGGMNSVYPIAEYLACLVPTGITGCGFESPLESMYGALTRARSRAGPEAGFLRTDANLLVILVSDATDCSVSPGGMEIFTTNKVFWDPGDMAPTSGVCWRAGVTCTDGPGTFSECEAADHDVDGAVTEDPTRAVLHPLSRYHALLTVIQAEKAAANSPGKVQLALIGGVPVAYPDTPLVYADDPDFQPIFGIGPGCDGAQGMAVPPVRERELAEAFAPLGPAVHSICQDSFAAPLAALARDIVGD